MNVKQDPGELKMTLAQLRPGESGRVRRVLGHGPIHRRILDMGLSKGALVEVEIEAPLRDPIKIKVRGYALSLRKSEARLIEVAPVAVEAIHDEAPEHREQEHGDFLAAHVGKQ